MYMKKHRGSQLKRWHDRRFIIQKPCCAFGFVWSKYLCWRKSKKFFLFAEKLVAEHGATTRNEFCLFIQVIIIVSTWILMKLCSRMVGIWKFRITYSIALQGFVAFEISLMFLWKKVYRLELERKNVNCQKSRKIPCVLFRSNLSLTLDQAWSACGGHMCAELVEWLMYRANMKFMQQFIGTLISFWLKI